MELRALAHGQTGRLIMFTQRNNHTVAVALHSIHDHDTSNHSYNALQAYACKCKTVTE